jgi:hypothetical protein
VETLASPATLCRLEQRADRESAVAIQAILFQQFIEAYYRPPRRLIRDFDASDTPLHGDQEGCFFHGFYDYYCFLSLYVFCGRYLLVSYLRRSDGGPARHSWAILALLVKALRRHWPKVEVVFRGDSGFCRWKLMRWCERHGVHYIIGIAKNNRLLAHSELWREAAETLYVRTGKKQSVFASIRYGAPTWDKRRRVAVKAEHTTHGANPRWIVTHLPQCLQQFTRGSATGQFRLKDRVRDCRFWVYRVLRSCYHSCLSQHNVCEQNRI